MKTLKTLKAELLADPEVRRIYDELTPEYEIARAAIAMRTAGKPSPGAGKSDPAPPGLITAIIVAMPLALALWALILWWVLA